MATPVFGMQYLSRHAYRFHWHSDYRQQECVFKVRYTAKHIDRLCDIAQLG